MGASQHRTACGTLYLSLRAVRPILALGRGAARVEVIYRRANPLARLALQILGRGRVGLARLDTDPYFLPAQHLCDAQKRNFRCDAIETTIATARRLVADMAVDIASIESAFGLRDCTDILRRYLRCEAGDSVKNYVYLGYHLLSLHARGEITDGVLLLPAAWWSAELARQLARTGLACREVALPGGEAAWLLGRLAASLRWRSGRVQVPQWVTRQGRDTHLDAIRGDDPLGRATAWPGPRLSAMIWDGLDYRLRNNVTWAWDSSLPVAALTLFLGGAYQAATDWERRLPAAGIHVVAHGAFGAPARRGWLRRAGGVLRILSAGWITGPRRWSASGRLAWSALRVAVLVDLARHWSRRLRREEVKVHVEFDYGLHAYARALAMRAAGGTTVLDQRSQYYDNYDHTSDRAGDVYFVSGAHGLRYYSPRLFEVPAIVITGLSADDGLAQGVPYAGGAGAPLPAVALFDEGGTLYGPEHVHRFVADVVGHCDRSGRYRLLFKPKRWLELFRSLQADTRDILQRLVSEGRCEILAPEVSVRSVCLASVAAVSVPSTTTCITIVAGIPTLVFNPFHTIRTMFYEHGLEGRCVFSGVDNLLAALDSLLTAAPPGIGRCDRVRQALDPWRDLEGNKRKGAFLHDLLCAFASGKERAAALDSAVAAYNFRNGAGLAGSWEQAWDASRGTALGLSLKPPRFDGAPVGP